MVSSLAGSEVYVDLHAGVDVQGGGGGTHREWTAREKKLVIVIKYIEYVSRVFEFQMVCLNLKPSFRHTHRYIP